MYKCDENINYVGVHSGNTSSRSKELITYQSEIKLTEGQMLLQNLSMLTCLPQAGIKAFRSQFRWVRKIDFFLFRLSNLFA